MKELQPRNLMELGTAYINRRRGALEPATVDLTERAWGYLVETVGNVDLGSFGFAQAERFQAAMLETGGRNRSSVNAYVRMVRPLFGWAMRNGWIDTDPWRHLRKLRVAKQEIQTFTDAEMQRLLGAVKSRLWQARILLAATAGLRRGEVLNLTVSELDFEAGEITIRPKADTPATWAWKCKDHDVRKVPLTDETAAFLARWVLEDLPEGQPYLMLTAQRYQRLIEMHRAGTLSDRLRKRPDENWKPFDRAIKRAQITKATTFHDLRRTCITRWLGYLQPQEVQQLAGHADISTTLQYYYAIQLGEVLGRARTQSQAVFGATGLEPATS